MSFVKFFLLLIIVLIITIGAFLLSEEQYINSSLGGAIVQVGLVLTLFLIIKGFISLFSKKKDKAKINKKKNHCKRKKNYLIIFKIDLVDFRCCWFCYFINVYGVSW